MDELSQARRSNDKGHRVRQQEKQHPNHPKDRWVVMIDVFLNSVDATGEPDFDIRTCLPTKMVASDPKHPEIQFDNAGRPGFSVEFRLFDNTNGGLGSGYRFPLEAKDGVWSQAGNGCPLGPAYEIFPEDELDVENKGLTLVGCNPNPSPAQGPFRYTLNVSIGGNPPYIPLDPGGNNMNGSLN